MVDHTCDALVVGAGPAGSMAAFYLARAGAKVTLVDRSSFPRVKPCGGGITVKALARLPFSVADVLEEVTRSVHVSFKHQRSRTFRTPGIVCALSVRERFDEFLLRVAIDVGADFQKIAKIESIHLDHEQVLATIDGCRIRAKYLVAADGANSKVRRLMSPGFPFSRGFAIEGSLAGVHTGLESKIVFDFGSVPFGYGWAFQKRDHVNVGIYTCRDTVKVNKDNLVNYCQRRLGRSDLNGIVGFPTGFGGHRYNHTSERVLFVGDAAGLCDPLLGEGIHNAIKSGELAGQAVAVAVRSGRPIGNRYNALLRHIRRDITVSRTIAYNFFYRFVDTIGFRTLLFPMVNGTLMRGYSAGRTLSEIVERPFQIHRPASFPTLSSSAGPKET